MAFWYIAFSTCATFCKRALQNVRLAVHFGEIRKGLILQDFTACRRRSDRRGGWPVLTPFPYARLLLHRGISYICVHYYGVGSREHLTPAFVSRIEFIASQTAERPGRLQGATMAGGDGPSAGKQQSGGKEDSHLGGFRLEGQARQGYVLKEKVMRGTQQPIVEHGRREMYARTRGHDLWGWVSHK
jgi:hypothetical protein